VTVDDAVAGRVAPDGRNAASEPDAPTPFQRARRDAAYLARLRAAYQGDDDVLDALWWLDHPTRPGPSGAVAPAARLAAARRDLYGPAASADAAARVAEALEAAERSRASALSAVALAAPPPVRAAPAARVAASSVRGASDVVAPQVQEDHSVLRRRVTLAVVGPLLLAAAVLGVVAGLGLGQGARPVTSAPTGEALAQHFQQTVAGDDALAVFDKAQAYYDLPGGAAASLDSSTARRLLVLGDSRLIGARTRGGSGGGGICLLIVDLAAHVSGSCGSVAEFRHAGLTLERPADRLPGDIKRIRWYPDGRIVWWEPFGDPHVSGPADR
jgi:hypothetical protein